jgi:serine/threonine protein kinase
LQKRGARKAAARGLRSRTIMTSPLDPNSVEFRIEDSSIIGTPLISYDTWIPEGYFAEGGMSRLYIVKHKLIPDFKAIVKFLGNEDVVKQIGNCNGPLDKSNFRKERIGRFLREAETMAKLPYCRNIIQLYDSGKTQKNQLYFVMEYIRGQSLADTINVHEEGLLPEEACAIQIQMHDALNVAHKHDIVHRDIKPDNILVDVNGTVVLTDFGVSHIQSMGGKTMLTKADDAFIGTPYYTSKLNLDRPRIDIDPAKTAIFEEGNDKYCVLNFRKYRVSEDKDWTINAPARYYIEIVPEQADISSLNGPVLFTELTGQSYFETKTITSANFAVKLIQTAAKDLYISRTGNGFNSSKWLLELSPASEKLFNRIIERSWQGEVEAVAEVLTLKGYYETIFRGHKGRLYRELGRQPTIEEAVQNLYKRTQNLCSERCGQYAECFKDDASFEKMYSEKGGKKLTRLILSLCKIGGNGNEAVEELLAGIEKRLNAALGTGRASITAAGVSRLKFFHQVYSGIKKIHPRLKNKADELESMLMSMDAGLGEAEYD